MKRERRHELKENELAELLGRWLTKIAPYSRSITVGLLLALLLYVAWAIWASWARAVEQDAWNALYAALETGGPADLEAVAERYPRTDPGHWAQLLAADFRLRTGCYEIQNNKANAAQELRKAVDGYLAVRDATVSPLFQQRVLWGLARAYEALSGTRQGQGELEKAIKTYQELVDRWPDGLYSELARRRIAFLSKEENKRFYDMFAAYEPQKTDPTSSPVVPAGGPPPVLPPPSQGGPAAGESSSQASAEQSGQVMAPGQETVPPASQTSEQSDGANPAGASGKDGTNPPQKNDVVPTGTPPEDSASQPQRADASSSPRTGEKENQDGVPPSNSTPPLEPETGTTGG